MVSKESKTTYSSDSLPSQPKIGPASKVEKRPSAGDEEGEVGKKDQQKKKRPDKEKSAGSKTQHVREYNSNGLECFKCGVTYKDTINFKNHILSHYYPAFFYVLPSAKPFICPFPGCDSKPVRDKFTLARHYAFRHKQIFVLTDITPEQLGANRIRGTKKRKSRGEGEDASSTPRPKKRKSSGEGGDANFSHRPKKIKGAPVSKSFFNTIDDDSDIDEAEKKLPSSLQRRIADLTSNEGKPDTLGPAWDAAETNGER
jgi:hypothetical protein